MIVIDYHSTMHCNEVLQVDPIFCDIFGPAERVLIYSQPINLRYIHKRVPPLVLYPDHLDAIGPQINNARNFTSYFQSNHVDMELLILVDLIFCCPLERHIKL